MATRQQRVIKAAVKLGVPQTYYGIMAKNIQRWIGHLRGLGGIHGSPENVKQTLKNVLIEAEYAYANVPAGNVRVLLRQAVLELRSAAESGRSGDVAAPLATLGRALQMTDKQ